MSEPRNFSELRRWTNGMLPTAVYEELYHQASLVSDEDAILELGTGHGTGAIAMAWGCMDADHRGPVVTVDRMSGGSRARYGGFDENLAIASGAFASFGASGMVCPYYGDVEDFYRSRNVPQRIGMVFIDMDGLLDRDFKALWDLMVAGCTIVVDDFAPMIRIRREWLSRAVQVDAKHRLTHNIITKMEESGLLSRDEVVRNTWFGYKSGSKLGSVFWDDVHSSYQDLVHSTGRLHGPVHRISTAAARRVPFARGASEWLRSR